MKHPKSYDSTPTTRKRMAKVRLKGGKAETLLAKTLWHKGYRYHKNEKHLPGSPDIAILRYHIAIFVDGEFWHGKDWDLKKSKLKRNREYWIEKIEENIERDHTTDLSLAQIGWIPVHFWEKDILKNVEGCVTAIEDIILERLVEQADEADRFADEE